MVVIISWDSNLKMCSVRLEDIAVANFSMVHPLNSWQISLLLLYIHFFSLISAKDSFVVLVKCVVHFLAFSGSLFQKAIYFSNCACVSLIYFSSLVLCWMSLYIYASVDMYLVSPINRETTTLAYIYTLFLSITVQVLITSNIYR